MGAPKLKHSPPPLPHGHDHDHGEVNQEKFQKTLSRVRQLEGEVSRTLDIMDQKVYQLECIMEFSRLMNSTLDTDSVREKSLKATCRLVNSETATLYLVDEKTMELYFETTLGAGGLIKQIRLPIDETSLAGSVALTGRSLQINDVKKDPRHFKTADKKSKFDTRNMIVCPVISKGKVIGVLQAINKLDQGFITEDLQLLESLSNQVAIAIENAMLYEKMRLNFYQTAEALAEAIDFRDLYTGGHSKRVAEFSVTISRELGHEGNFIDDIKLAAVLHDIGKIGIDDCILRKQGKLNDEEYDIMKLHPEIGYQILSHIEDLKDVTLGIRHHHEKFDGSGYPMGLKEYEVPEIARIIAVADTFDAITSTRPYRKAQSIEFAIKELNEWSGKQFDPKIVDAFMTCYRRKEITPHSINEKEEERKRIFMGGRVNMKKPKVIKKDTKRKLTPEDFER